MKKSKPKSEDIHLRTTLAERTFYNKMAQSLGITVADYLRTSGKKNRVQIVGIKNASLVRYLTGTLSMLLVEMQLLNHTLNLVYRVVDRDVREGSGVDIGTLLNQMLIIEGYVKPVMNNTDTLITQLQGMNVYKEIFKVHDIKFDVTNASELETAKVLNNIQSIVADNKRDLEDFDNMVAQEYEQIEQARNERKQVEQAREQERKQAEQAREQERAKEEQDERMKKAIAEYFKQSF